MNDLQLPKHEVARLERRVTKLQAGLDAREADCGDGAGAARTNRGRPRGGAVGTAWVAWLSWFSLVEAYLQP